MTRRIWTRAEEQLLRQQYANTPTRDLARQLGRPKQSVYAKAQLMGLMKSEAYMNSPDSGRLLKGVSRSPRSQFKPGHITWNKGKKLGNAWCTPGMKRTQFKKGRLPHNTKTDGAETVRHTKGKAYVWVRIALGQWREKHRLLWEQHHGPIPKGMNVQFKNKNTLDVRIENLYLIARKAQMLENTIHRYPAEVEGAIRAISKLKRKLNTYEKQD